MLLTLFESVWRECSSRSSRHSGAFPVSLNLCRLQFHLLSNKLCTTLFAQLEFIVGEALHFADVHMNISAEGVSVCYTVYIYIYISNKKLYTYI